MNKMLPVEVESNELTILINQYYVAVDLYKHEDLLNWNKLNNLLYATGGLGAIYAFFLNNRESIVTSYIDPLVFVAVLGCLVSAGFFTALFFGVKYLQNRKKKVCDIDEVMKMNGGIDIVGVISVNAIHKFNYHRFSPTNLVLLLFPIVIFLGWVLVLVLSVVKS